MSKKIAITFPGATSQSVGILAALPVFDPASLDTAMESINA
jgi:hypothetical protein